MASNWNRYLETRQAADINLAESRLLDAIARKTLGFYVFEARIGEKWLRAWARLNGRRFIPARRGLIEKGLISYTPGKPGRGNRGLYRINLCEKSPVPELVPAEEEKPLVEGAFSEGEKPRLEGDLAKELKAPPQTQKKPRLEGVRIGKGLKDTGGLKIHELRGSIIANYSSKGGNLEKDGWRAMLAKHVTQLLKAGTDPELVMTAAGLLAREPDPFPGNLTKLVKQIEAEGMPCKHRGDLRGLTKAQLEECGCRECLGRIAFAEAKGLDTAYLQPLKAA
jgi:hypothetical protein